MIELARFHIYELRLAGRKKLLVDLIELYRRYWPIHAGRRMRIIKKEWFEAYKKKPKRMWIEYVRRY